METNQIPSREDPERHDRHDFQQGEFVEVTDSDRIQVAMQYPILGMEHAYGKCMLRREVYDRLLRAAERLPEGLHFVLWDGWRPFALQNELFHTYAEQLISTYHLDAEPEEIQKRFVSRYVCAPIEDRDCPPVHTTGGAIDLTLADSQGSLLPMGTAFDAFTPLTHTDYYETHNEGPDAQVIRENRRILYQTLTAEGFTNYPSEWWHYDYGDYFWAYYTKRPAIYRGVFTEKEMRDGHGKGNSR